MRRILVSPLILILRLSRVTCQDPCYPVEIKLFESDDACSNGEQPVAVGRLFADNTCRVTQVINSNSSSLENTFNFPGRYIARCNSNKLEISDSGCSNSDCSNSIGGETCDRDNAAASLFSRLDPPIFTLKQESSTTTPYCITLTNNKDVEIVFTLIGDCSVACEDAFPTIYPSVRPTASPTASPSTLPSAPPSAIPSALPSALPSSYPSSPETALPSANPSATPSTPVTSPPSVLPTSFPSVIPTAIPSNEPSTRPTQVPSKEPSVSKRPTSIVSNISTNPTKSPIDQQVPTNPTDKVNDTAGHRPSYSPLKSPWQPTSYNATAKQLQTSEKGIIAGSVVAGVFVVFALLLIGFFMGMFRQRKRHARVSRDSSTFNGSHGDSKGHRDESALMIPTAVTPTSAVARTSSLFDSTQFFGLDGQDDDVSTLATPIGFSFLEDTATDGESSCAGISINKNQLLTDEEPDMNMKRTISEDSSTIADVESMDSKAAFSQDFSFEDIFQIERKSQVIAPNAKPNRLPVNCGKMFTVSVPPGKLGMVIDDYFSVTGQTSPSATKSPIFHAKAPTVLSLKNDSILKQRGVRVGDVLESVDGIDVTYLNCMDVSKMVTAKSASTRVFGFAR